MLRLLLLALLSTNCLPAFTSKAEVRVSLKARDERHLVGLCVRTARDGYVVLEARLMRSSGTLKTDGAALEDVIGRPVPMPNQRMWFEWMPMQLDYGPASEKKPDEPMPDCSALEREAKVKAGVR